MSLGLIMVLIILAACALAGCGVVREIRRIEEGRQRRETRKVRSAEVQW